MRDIRWEYNIDIILTYVTTDDDQTNPTTKKNVIQQFLESYFCCMIYNNVYSR